MKFQFKTIRNRLTFWFIFLTFLFLIMVIVVIYFQRVQSIESDSIEKLTAIRNLKVAQVNSWIDERMADIKTITGDYEIRDLETVTLKKSSAQSTAEALKTAKYLLFSYMQNYKDYNEIFIIHPKTSKIFCSTNKTSEGVNKSEDLYFTEPLKTGKPYIKDIYYSKALNRNTMTFSAPIYCGEHGVHIVGIVVARVDLKNSLYSLLLDRTGMGLTGETLIVNKDRLALNELRWYANAPLRLKITAEPAKRAVQGETGTIEVTDYRDVKVLAAYTFIPKTNWGFIAKQDLKEINAPIKAMIFDFFFLLAVAIVIVLVVSFYLTRSISRPVIEMTANAKKMQAGNFLERNKLFPGDELGYLAQSFNALAASISSRIFIQKNNADIAQLMVEADHLNTFSRELLKKLLHISESNLGAFYLINEQTDTFEPLFTIGLNSERLQSFNAKHLEGEFGHVLTSKKITRLEKIPENFKREYESNKYRILEKYNNVEIWDYSNEFMADKYFLDSDHLNNKGAVIFSELIKRRIENLRGREEKLVY